MSTHLESLARRLESDPQFLACALRIYADSDRLDDAGLANALGCTLETLTRLRLCQVPAEDRFKQDVECIASRFPVNREALARAARRGQILLQMRRDTPSDRGLLLAARDEEQDDAEKHP